MTISNKRAFSLTELLIVLVVVAVLFAALAPIVTKRRTGVGAVNESVWYYVNNDDQMDSYYDPGVPGWTSTAFFGVDPRKFSDYKPYAKVIIKASSHVGKKNIPQNMMQFRYGTGSGQYAGSLFMDGKNLLLTYQNEKFLRSSSQSAALNTVAGPGAFANIRTAAGNTAFGSNAMRGYAETSADKEFGLSSLGSHYVAVGNKVLTNATFKSSNWGIYMGSGAGQSMVPSTLNGAFRDNIAIGANAMGNPFSYGAYNIYLGYLTGNAASNTIPEENIVAGSAMTSKSSTSQKYNVVLGYDSYKGGASTKYLTSVGFNACSSFNIDNPGPRTCIGYTSGAKSSGDTSPSSHTTDSDEHVYLGGVPVAGFSGRGVVEVHNLKTTSSNNRYYPTSAHASVVFNSNIVVRGNLYFPDDSGNVSMMNIRKISDSETLQNWDDCCRSCVFGRKKWRYFGCCIPHWRKQTPTSNTFLYYASSCGTNPYSFYNGNCPQLSDIRLKDNLEEYSGGYDEILALMPYNYTFKADKSNRPQVGVIAQDLEKVFPTSVSEGKDGYLSIRWDEMFYGLINSIKTLGAKVEKLASDIGLIEADVKQLKSSNKDIKKRIASLNSRTAKLERK